MMKKNVEDFLRQHSINRLIIGVSGGADSMVLLHILSSLNIELLAVHCNFHLRGKESDRDMDFVSEYCRVNSIPLEIIHFNAKESAEKLGISIEMACRDLRYDVFKEMLSSRNFQRIAVAHHADDNIETLLLNLFRGTGISGLRGMLPDTGTIIRPLLQFSKKEILGFAAENDIPFITDSSNLSDDYKRNFIRNRLLPEIEEVWPGVRNTLTRNIGIFRQQEQIVNDYLEDAMDDDDALYFRDIRNLASPESAIHFFLMKHGENTPAIAKEMGRLLRSDSPKGGRKWILKNHTVFTDSERFYLAARISDSDIRNYKINIEKLGNNPENLKAMKQEKGNSALYVGIDPYKLRFRTFQTGDRIAPLGMKGTSLVSDIMKDAKLPAVIRQQTLLAVAPDGEIIWVENLKRSRRYLVAPSDNAIYRITITR